jgi:hypothetical protein
MVDQINKVAVDKPPLLIIVLVTLQALLGIGGLYGAFILLSDISGAKMGVPLSLLDGLPVHDFLIPGLVLLVFNGFLPLLTLSGLIKKKSFSFLNKANILGKYYWAYSYAIFNAFFLIGWTAGELILWGVNFLSVLYFVWGIMTLILCLIPKVKKYYYKF